MRCVNTDARYLVGGTVSGLVGTMTLEINRGEALTISANGGFQFPTGLLHQQTYNVIVVSKPAQQQCVISNGSGTVDTFDISNINVSCADEQYYQVGGAVTGLIGVVRLQLNGAETISLNADGSFRFQTNLGSQQAYNVSVLSKPARQQCLLANANGAVGTGDIADVAVTCSDILYAVGGNVNGLAGELVLQLNGTTTLAVNSSSGAYQFPPSLILGAAYNVAIINQPVGQRCNIAAGVSSGTMPSQNINSVNIFCGVAHYNVGGTVEGLDGTLGLSINGGNAVTLNANGSFQFTPTFTHQQAYSVQVVQQPAGQQCTIANGSGTINSADVSNISVSCTHTPYFVGGSVTGLMGDLKIQLNGNEILDIGDDGSFAFAASFLSGESYSVAIAAQPDGQQCIAANAAGLIHGDVEVVINCELIPESPVITHVWPDSLLGGHEAKISGSNLKLATITLNGAAIEPTSRTANELRFVAPQNPRGSYLLELENAGGYVSRTVAQGQLMNNVVAIDTGKVQSCALLGSGEVRCWGDNTNGELGNGNNIASPSPVAVRFITDARAISVGAYHACAVLASGHVRCWGLNSTGQLGGNGTTNSSTPVGVSLINNNAVGVSAGYSHSCAVMANGAVRCWGYNDMGQLGTGNTTASTAPETVTGLSGAAVSVAVGSSHSCALLSDRTVQCWGNNSVGQLGNGGTGFSLVPVTVSGITNALSISVGSSYSCARLTTGSVKCWGSNYYGQLGDGTTVNRAIPVLVSGIGNASTINTGDYSSCAVLADGAVRCWGFNEKGFLSVGNYTNSAIPLPVNDVGNVVSISTSSYHSCVILTAGAVKCWGENELGQLGNGTKLTISSPVTIRDLADVKTVDGGLSFNCAVLNDGGVKCWGDNGDGQLGDGGLAPSLTPVSVGLDADAVSVSAGLFHSCAQLITGEVRCWGSGLLGTGRPEDYVLPVAVSGLTNAIALAAGEYYTCAARSSGEVWCWGEAIGAVLGHGSITGGAAPVKALNVADAFSVGAGRYHSCALAGSSALCWGINEFGKLGDGTTVSKWTAVPVNISLPLSSIHLGVDHTCALATSGSVYCWGGNNYGQLGDASLVNKTTPVAVGGTGFTARSLSVGGAHGCAVLNSGKVMCWGSNSRGQLGVGNVTRSSIPIEVAGISDAVSVNAGSSHTCAVLATGAVQCWGSAFGGQLSLPGHIQLAPGMPVYYP